MTTAIISSRPSSPTTSGTMPGRSAKLDEGPRHGRHLMIKLYDFELSGCCYKVRLLLNILKVSCERVPVDFANREHKGDSFLKLNPLGEIPVMEDGEVRLRDSQSILVYIARQYDRSSTWFPDAPGSMGRIMQWLSFGGHELMTAAG